jgi:hypothetical protein
VRRASGWGRSRTFSAWVITRPIGRSARRLEKRVSGSKTNHLSCACRLQGRGRGRHRRPRGDDVVNDQHDPRRRAGPEGRTVPSRLAGLARLGWSGVAAQEPATGQPCLSGHGPGQEPGLVIASATATGPRGRYPRDHVNHVGFDQGAHSAGQPRHRGPSVAVLEAGQKLSCRPLVSQGGEAVVEPGRRVDGRGRAQRADATPARGRTRSVAQRAPAGQEHGFDPTQG